MTLLWTLYLHLRDLLDHTRDNLRRRWECLAAHPESGDMNISKAAYAALAVALAAVLAAAITAAVTSRVTSIQ